MGCVVTGTGKDDPVPNLLLVSRYHLGYHKPMDKLNELKKIMPCMYVCGG